MAERWQCAECTLGECFSKEDIGTSEFEKMCKEVIRINLAHLDESIGRMISRGVPSKYIIYCVKHWDSPEGRWYYNKYEISIFLLGMISCNRLHRYGSKYTGYCCFAMDGRDFKIMKKLFRNTLSYAKPSFHWKQHVQLMMDGKDLNTIKERFKFDPFSKRAIAAWKDHVATIKCKKR